MSGRRTILTFGAAALAIACAGRSSEDRLPSQAAAGTGSLSSGGTNSGGDAGGAGTGSAGRGDSAGNAGTGGSIVGSAGAALAGTAGESAGSGGTGAGAASGGNGGAAGEATGGAGGSTAGTSSGAAGGAGGVGGVGGVGGGETAGAGAEGGTPTFPAKPLCGGEDGGNTVWCSGIENVRIELGSVADESGDGRVSPGEVVSLTFTLRNEGMDSYNYPCVGVLADNADVEILGGVANDNPAWEVFGIGAGTTIDMTLRVRVGESVPVGRRVHFLAWIDVLRAACTNGNEIQFDLTVE